MTLLLRQWRGGDQAALDRLTPLVYDELRRLAARQLRGERPGHTFRPTDLVSEAFVRLMGGKTAAWNDRVHFFAVAARTMRHILVDHARRWSAQKRGAGERALSLEEDLVGLGAPQDLIELDIALGALEKQDGRKARVVELHYFAGLTQEEIGTALGVHVNTVAGDLRFAEAWITRQLADDV